MIPVNNGYTSPCSPISSNCVIWQGPDIPCIGICNGDTVSDVVGKLGEELCNILDASCQCNPDISGLDLNCLPSDTSLDIESVLQAIITYICELNTTVNATLPNIQLCSELQYDDQLGNPVLALPLDQFATLLGNKVCDIIQDINNINLAVVDLQTRVTVLENCVLPCTAGTPPAVIDVLSSCFSPGTLVPIDELVQQLEDQFCEFRSAVGNVSLINSAISAQCLFGTTDTLSGSGTYGSIPGWVTAPATLAQSNINQWIVLCDLWAAVRDIQNNCCVTGCDGVVFDVHYSTIDNNGDGVVDAIDFTFTGSTIPTGFNDCGGSTTITITDSLGASVTQNATISTLAGGGSITIPLGSLNATSAVTVTIPFCVSDGTSQCADYRTLVIPLNIPCPTLTVTATSYNITASFINSLGTSAVYQIVALNASTGGTLGTAVITNPGALVFYTFGGAIPATSYNIVLTISQGGSTKTCPVQTVITGDGPMPETYNCVAYNCVDPGDGTGTYSSLAACQAACVPPVTYNCSFGFCLDPGDGTGTYTDLATCQAACTPVPCVEYDISNSTGADVQFTYGNCSDGQDVAMTAPNGSNVVFCALQGSIVDPSGALTINQTGDCPP